MSLTGESVGDAVVLGFVTGGDGCAQPLRKLFDFDRVRNLEPGDTKSVVLTVPMEVLSAFAHKDSSAKCKRNTGINGRQFVVEIGDTVNPATSSLELY